MAASEAPPIVNLGLDDVEAAMVLSAEAGWNQTADDWRHFLSHGDVLGIRDGDGRLIASAAALPYDGPFGFVSMVLVTPAWRRQGLATRLVDHCVAVLRRAGLTPVLDATEAGETVYVHQGFVPQFRFQRWQGDLPGASSLSPLAHAGNAPAVAALDKAAFGAGRERLIDDFLFRDESRAVVADDGDGFAIVRGGRRAFQIGPVVASSEAAALKLLERLFTSVRGAAFIDVPTAWRGVGDWLSARGFEVQRGFARMALGRAEPFCRPERLFAVAGPEFG